MNQPSRTTPATDADEQTGARKKAAKADRRRAPETKSRILDAAEELFVRRGYHGASLRDISRSADVRTALTHYHFGTKEDLFRAVVDRRAADNVGGLRAALEQLRASQTPEHDDPEALFLAFIQPIVDRSVRGGAGWRNYVRLLAQVANMPEEETVVTAFNEHYDAVVCDFIKELRRMYPDMPADDIHWAFYFFQAAMTHILTESGMVDRQSEGLCRSSDLDVIAAKMARFFGAGLRAIAEG